MEGLPGELIAEVIESSAIYMSQKKKDKEWYEECWNSSQKKCMECGLVIRHFHPMFISHIITKGSFPQLRNHPRNFMIYCMNCHQQWEFGNRKAMKTYDEAQRITEELKREYYDQKK